MKNSIIISAELSTLDTLENQLRTKQLIKDLNRLEIPFTTVNGMYKGSTEQSFIIESEFCSHAEIFKLAVKYKQEAVLVLNHDCIGTLYYMDNSSPDIIGKFKALDSYTRIGHNVYTCEPLATNLDTTEYNIRRLNNV